MANEKRIENRIKRTISTVLYSRGKKQRGTQKDNSKIGTKDNRNIHIVHCTHVLKCTDRGVQYTHTEGTLVVVVVVVVSYI